MSQAFAWQRLTFQITRAFNRATAAFDRRLTAAAALGSVLVGDESREALVHLRDGLSVCLSQTKTAFRAIR
jgi:hypothetical protein